MVPSGLPPAACGTPLISLLLVCCLLLPGAPGQQFQLRAEVQSPVVPAGGSFLVNCSSDCPNPELITLETSLSKEPVGNGLGWAAFQLSNATTDSQVLCSGFCNRVQMIGSSNIIVYRFPERVELLPLPRWQPVGENFTLRCQVAGGAPRTSLTVVLLRGEEELSRKPAFGEPAEITATVLAGRDDHLANFSCRTELDLRPRGLGLFQNSSAPRQLRTFVLPETQPRLATPEIVEVGTQWTVNCSLDGLFPAAEAEVHLTLAEQKLHSTPLYGKDSVLATAIVKANAEEEGTQQLACVVTLGGQDRKRKDNVILYSFPAPNLTLSEPEVSEGTVVTVDCEAQAGVVVSLSGLPSGTPAPRAQFQLNASAADHRRSFSCSAALLVAGHLLHKNQTRELHVLYGPRLDQTDCPGNWTWEEGSQQTLRCQAWGNPVPELKCHRKGDDALLPIGDLRPVKREVAGTYLCQARSPRGVVTREVVVNVTYYQSNMLIIILVAVAGILGTVSTAAYLYNRQRKIQKYKLQKAQEAAAMKLNTPATPP